MPPEEVKDSVNTGFEWIERDANGVKYDSKGNPLSYGYAEPGVCYYGRDGKPMSFRDVWAKPLRYVDVYPGPTNVHQNKALSNIAVSYEIDSGIFVGPTIAPVLNVQHRSDTFYKIAKGDVTRDYGNALDRAVGAMANEVNEGFSTDTYSSVWYSLRSFLPDKLTDNQDEVLDLMTRKTRFLQNVIDLAWDRRLVTNMLTATGTFTNATFTAAGGGKVTSATEALRYIHLATIAADDAVQNANNGQRATHVIMSSLVAMNMAASPEIIGQIKLGMGPESVVNGGWAGPNYGLPSKLYGKTVVVLPHVTNSGKKGQSDSFAKLLTDTVGFFVIEQPSRQTRNTVTTFRVGSETGVKTYRDEPRGGTWIEVSVDQDEKVTNASGGYLLTDAI